MTMGEVTDLLARTQQGEEGAEAALYQLIFGELRALAETYLTRETASRLDPTELVNEAYLRLTSLDGASFDNRRRFFALASTTIRRVLVDEARRRLREEKKLATISVPLVKRDEETTNADLLDLQEGLLKLERIDPELVRVAELRLFGGLSVDETAASMEVSKRTAERKWRAARTWLEERLRRQRPAP